MGPVTMIGFAMLRKDAKQVIISPASIHLEYSDAARCREVISILLDSHLDRESVGK